MISKRIIRTDDAYGAGYRTAHVPNIQHIALTVCEYFSHSHKVYLDFLATLQKAKRDLIMHWTRSDPAVFRTADCHPIRSKNRFRS